MRIKFVYPDILLSPEMILYQEDFDDKDGVVRCGYYTLEAYYNAFKSMGKNWHVKKPTNEGSLILYCHSIESYEEFYASILNMFL